MPVSLGTELMAAADKNAPLGVLLRTQATHQSY